MWDHAADRIAGLIALAAIGFAMVATLATGFISYTSVLPALAVVMLVGGAWWLLRQQPGTPFREMAVPAAVATVMPLLVATGISVPDGALRSAAFVLSAAAAATLGTRLAEELPEPYRLPITLTTVALAVGGAALALLVTFSFDAQRLAMLALAGTTAVPGITGAALRHAPVESGRGSVVSALELGVVGLTPAIAVLTVWNAGGTLRGWAPLTAWILIVLAAHYFAVRPLARTAAVATTQRDIVVAAMEAERSRIAADIHDDALQELTLLGWRLDAAGDVEGATAAREIADRLRRICGDLRLPILDDLGAGPALEWLVERISRLVGGEVRLERGDQVRPPAEVELAFFRVAQEALSNAVRHGRPPIVVRYWTSPSGASLSIDDSGGGFDSTRAGVVDGERFGLLNMRQRAEQIGALLDIRRWPSGGTQVALEWRGK